MAKGPSIGQYMGLGLSFGVTMFVSIWITTKVGGWLDGLFGLAGVFEFIGLIIGIISGFRLLMENIAALDRNDKKDRMDDE